MFKSLLIVQSYCQRMIHKTCFITTCKYQRCPIPWQKKYISVVLFGFSIFWKTAMMFMWCIVFQLVAIIKKKKIDLQKICFLLIIRWRPQPKQQSSISSLSKLKVKYSKAFQGSNITLSSCSMQPPVASRVLPLWDWRVFNLLSRLTPIINLTYSHQHGSYHSHASSAS